MRRLAKIIMLFGTSSVIIIEGVRARVSQPSFYNSLPVCSIRTYLKENRQEL